MSALTWKGKELKSMGDVLDAVEKCVTREEAQEFMGMYRADTPHADDNIGYGAGYFDAKTSKRIWDWFGVSHPVFGTTIPTPEEAFAAGVKMGEESKRTGKMTWPSKSVERRLAIQKPEKTHEERLREYDEEHGGKASKKNKDEEGDEQ